MLISHLFVFDWMCVQGLPNSEIGFSYYWFWRILCSRYQSFIRYTTCVWMCWDLFLLVFAYGPLNVPAPFVGKSFLSPLNSLCTFVKQLNVFDLCGSFCGLSILFQWAICLSFHQCYQYYYRFISLEICWCEPCMMVLTGQNCFCYFQWRNLANITFIGK